MQLPDLKKITVDKIYLPGTVEKNFGLDVLRLDKIHPLISGNKWFKLKYHLQNFQKGNYNGILTFGGAWSNHILATACACYQEKINCIGIIRGEESASLSATLEEALKLNMNLKFISRDQYRKKSEKETLKKLTEEFPGYYIIPEGAAGPEGEKGSGEILELVNKSTYTHIACAIGSSTMFRGLLNTISSQQKLIGIPVIKGFTETTAEDNSEIFSHYHFGGYARHTTELLQFMNNFYKLTSVPTDIVYTGKLCFAVDDLINKNYFPDGSKLLIIHSGGLQGNQSLPNGTLIF